MPLIHKNVSFLGDHDREALLTLLRSPDVKWARSGSLGRTAEGNMVQLANSAMHQREEIVSLSDIMASAVYDELARLNLENLPTPDELSPQVFPVWMWGSPDDPPTQWPHCDSFGDRHPVFTALYYPLVTNVRGGRLILHGVPEGQTLGVEPVTDLLLIIDGDQLHSVEPLTAGERVTVVTNFYVASELERGLGVASW